MYCARFVRGLHAFGLQVKCIRKAHVLADNWEDAPSPLPPLQADDAPGKHQLAMFCVCVCA